MSIVSEITRLQNAKEDLKTAINNKGGNITNEKLDNYANEVVGLPSVVEMTESEYEALDTPNENSYYSIIDKGFVEITDRILKIYKGSTLIYEKEEEEKYYLTFQSPDEFSLKTYNTVDNWDGILYYSTNLVTWDIWTGTEISSYDGKLYLRGTGNTTIAGNSKNYGFVLTGNNIACTGNIETLLDYQVVENGSHPSMADYCYSHMFWGCTALTTVPKLPATELSIFCYGHMFHGCTALTTAPELPATTLKISCYSFMFQGCTALTTAPELPVTTLESNCYNAMFYGCTALTTVPKLPATELSTSCYSAMFYNCTALTTVPELPATTLESNCYKSMFSSCTALKVSETKTGVYQYEWRIPTVGTGVTASKWNTTMLLNTGGTFKSSPAIDTTYYVQNQPV